MNKKLSLIFGGIAKTRCSDIVGLFQKDIETMKKYPDLEFPNIIIGTTKLIGIGKDHLFTKEIRLQMAIKTVNDITGYNRLVPTLLVFSIYPRILNNEAFLLSILQKARGIKRAIIEVSNIYASRQTDNILYQRNGL